MFPDETHILDPGTENARPNTESLRNDDNFRHDCARYTENIAQGKHDEEWLHQAWVAHEKHKRGDFDDFLRKSFESDWGVKLPKEGGSSSHASTSSSDKGGSEEPASSPGTRRGNEKEKSDSKDSDIPLMLLRGEGKNEESSSVEYQTAEERGSENEGTASKAAATGNDESSSSSKAGRVNINTPTTGSSSAQPTPRTSSPIPVLTKTTRVGTKANPQTQNIPNYTPERPTAVTATNLS